MEMLGLAKVKRVAPKLLSSDSLANCDLDTLQSIITNRLEVTTRFIRSIRKQRRRVARSHKTKRGFALSNPPKLAKRHGKTTSDLDKKHIGEFIKQSKTMGKIVKIRQELESLWNDKNAQTNNSSNACGNGALSPKKAVLTIWAFFAQSLRGF